MSTSTSVRRVPLAATALVRVGALACTPRTRRRERSISSAGHSTVFS
ncbi:hypothetical protein [Streptomyces sp. NPDC002788]